MELLFFWEQERFTGKNINISSHKPLLLAKQYSHADVREEKNNNLLCISVSHVTQMLHKHCQQETFNQVKLV